MAILVAWRRRPQARHALAWAVAFALTGAGWLAAALMACGEGLAAGPGATAHLAWLAAGLCFVHGLRLRAGRADRGGVLAAIWAGIAAAATLLLDLAPATPLAGAGAAMLDGIGLLIGAIAIGPRRVRRRPIDWGSMLVLAVLAASHLLLATVLLFGALSWPTVVATVLGAALVYVAVGLGTMLLISGDLALALERLARTDPLTGVWNRRGFDEASPVLLERLLRMDEDAPAAVAIADLDRFKSVNDHFGHHTGDAVLTRFAEQLRAAAQQGDLLARLGGEEFALLSPGTDAIQLRDRLERVRVAMGQAADDRSTLPTVTASFGVAQMTSGARSLREAMERADRALYQAKQDGRNRTVLDPI